MLLQRRLLMVWRKGRHFEELQLLHFIYIMIDEGKQYTEEHHILCGIFSCMTYGATNLLTRIRFIEQMQS